MSGKYALIIGNTDYIDPGLAKLTAPGKDVEDFARILQDQDICGFDDVRVLLNQISSSIIEAIDEFFDQKKPDDLLVLFFSGHGVRDEYGSLYLGVKNTIRSRLRSTAIKSDYIREVMDQSRSKRQVLILDCCNSGAFGDGTKAATGMSIGTASEFKAGYGRIILTASDSTQFAWEGDKVIGETDNSLFTHFLVQGLEGEADLDGDGRITVDELYDYAYEKVKVATPKQTPSKFSSRQQGEIVLRQSIPLEDIKPVPLPAPLINSIENPFADIRLGAVQQLIKYLNGRNIGLAHSAREALEKIASEDDSFRVKQAADQALDPLRQAEHQKVEEEAELLLAEQRATEERVLEEERMAEARAEEERLAKLEAERLAAKKEEEERLNRLEVERKAKEEAELLAAIKAEQERLARSEAERLAAQKAEEERLAKLEAERKAKEEAKRLAALKAEQERLAGLEAEQKARERAARISAWKAKVERVVSLAKKPASRTTIFGISAGVVFIIIVAAGILGLPGLFKSRTPTATVASIVSSTNIPETRVPTTIPETPTLNDLIPPAGSLLKVGTMHAYADGSVLVAVPAGEFSMGGNGNDNPKHSVTLSDYWIYSTKVTNQQYAFCMTQGKCTVPDLTDNPGYSDNKRANDPVTGVTYDQAAAYCSFVNGRLPTEAEWEKAAGSQQGGKYPWGDAAPTCDLLNFNNCNTGMTSVIKYPKGGSYYGALDMAGNAFEWVADWYNTKYYSGSPSENPQGPETGTKRSVRSSSYQSNESQVLVAKRNFESPKNHRSDLGFRCAVDDPNHFASFCELPVEYSTGSADANSLVSCPTLAIDQTPFCGSTGPQTNVTFIAPADTNPIIDATGCVLYKNNTYTCMSPVKTVSMDASCKLNAANTSICPSGYSAQNGKCFPNETGQTGENCLAGEYDTSLQCCNLPAALDDTSADLKICQVGSFPAANSNTCFSQPVQELVTYSEKVEYTACSTAPGGGGKNGGGSGGGGGGSSCVAQSCGSGLSWSSSSCCCVAPGSNVCQ